MAAGARVYSHRLPGRPLLRQRLAHHGRDGRDLGAAAEARRRHLVRDRRRVAQARHALHQRPRPHPLRVPAHRRAAPSCAPISCPTTAARRSTGSTLANPAQTAKTVTVKVDVHSELIGAYPWTGSVGHPTAADNLDRHPPPTRTAGSSSPTAARSPAPRPTTTPRSSAPPAPRRASEELARASAVRSPAPCAPAPTRPRRPAPATTGRTARASAASCATA